MLGGRGAALWWGWGGVGVVVVVVVVVWEPLCCGWGSRFAAVSEVGTGDGPSPGSTLLFPPHHRCDGTLSCSPGDELGPAADYSPAPCRSWFYDTCTSYALGPTSCSQSVPVDNCLRFCDDRALNGTLGTEVGSHGGSVVLMYLVVLWLAGPLGSSSACQDKQCRHCSVVVPPPPNRCPCNVSYAWTRPGRATPAAPVPPLTERLAQRAALPSSPSPAIGSCCATECCT
jgi:hypothetical protein